MLAAIHYREYGLRREGPSNKNGPYQIWGRIYPVGSLTDEQFQQATNDAAEFIVTKVVERNLNLDNNVKYTFLRTMELYLFIKGKLSILGLHKNRRILVKALLT